MWPSILLTASNFQVMSLSYAYMGPCIFLYSPSTPECRCHLCKELHSSWWSRILCFPFFAITFLHIILLFHTFRVATHIAKLMPPKRSLCSIQYSMRTPRLDSLLFIGPHMVVEPEGIHPDSRKSINSLSWSTSFLWSTHPSNYNASRCLQRRRRCNSDNRLERWSDNHTRASYVLRPPERDCRE